MSPAVPASKLRRSDVARVAVLGLRARTARAALSALGIAIGIASLVGVLGLSESSKSDLIDQLNALGTNLLTVTPGQGFGVGDAELPDTSVQMVERLPTVESVASVAEVDAAVFRNDLIPEEQTGALSVLAADPELLETLNGSMAEGTFLDDGATEYPAAVLGSVAAERLGITDLNSTAAISIGGQRVQVAGIIEAFPLAEDLDRAVFIGAEAARTYFDPDIVQTSVYVRTEPDAVVATRDILPATVDPEHPEEVEITRPSDVLEAEAAAESAFTSLFVGLGLVALVVGGIGIANVMVIGVIERRGEIGLRRAIGATRAHIRTQFLTEALLLGIIGGISGVALGALTTAGYATSQGWRVVIPPVAYAGGLIAAAGIGALAGLYPAVRAARMPPTEALRAD